MEIKGLYKLKREDEEKLIQTYKEAFADYPKLMVAFPDKRAKEAALEASLRYYVAYDMEYGEAFALDPSINEGVCLVYSKDMTYTEEKHIQAGSYSPEYKAAMAQLTEEEQQCRVALFDELDRLEEQVDIPEPHLYADFLGVRPACQRQGRGHKLMEAVCAFAKEEGLPIMLFTNTDDDVAFYQSLGFRVIDVVHSEKFGFTNTYLIKEAK